MILLFILASISTAAPLSPRQLVLPGAGTNYWWPSAATSTSTYASYIASSVIPSSTSSSSSSSAISTKPFNFLYLIPVFAVVGLLSLIGILWLIHGCCTRKPKYRPPPPPPPPPPPKNISFKAFRYEDIPPVDPEHEDVDQCQHVREYGFQCDYRTQTGSYNYRWPSDSFDGRDAKHVEKEDGDGGCLDIRVKDEAKKDSAGFRMVVDDDLISSSSPLSLLSTRIKLDDSNLSNDRWMEKVVNALGSRFSSGSGKSEDGYTAVPGTSNSNRRRPNKLVKKEKKKLKKWSTRISSSHTSSDQTSTITTTEVDDILLLSQQRRLQNHRESIASLPAGMVFSPPSVGFSVFGEEESTTTIGDRLVPKVLLR